MGRPAFEGGRPGRVLEPGRGSRADGGAVLGACRVEGHDRARGGGVALSGAGGGDDAWWQRGSVHGGAGAEGGGWACSRPRALGGRALSLQ
eukprot:scaffold94830_cov45-Phaeocystis_antarctica.AAC.1